ncbi:MAG: histidine--tRNA ligase [Thermomicrobiales bacterium]|nr:histidine--tRNA ligase [Thermomicrobiales bacterium]
MFKRPRGTADYLPDDQPYRRYVRNLLESLCETYGYGFIESPVFEDAGLFVRGVGEGTDIVEKEMYIFEDRGGDRLALRPEITAPTCRAYLEHGMFNLPQPVRLAYIGPSFRYERPQAGRLRAFTQFGAEAIGEADPAVDAEIIELAWRICERMRLQSLNLFLNSIGDRNCRPAYVERLRQYYSPRLGEVCGDCRVRFERNPLRLLDCKVPSCQPIIASAPTIAENLCVECDEHFRDVRAFIEAAGIPYTIQSRLVRGLDYYTRTVFEVVPEGAGQQGTVLGGGRYDGLIEELGGRPTPALGFAMGIERAVINLKEIGFDAGETPAPDAFIAYLGTAARAAAARLARDLRGQGIAATLAMGGRSLKAQLRHAGAARARFAVIIGDDELASGSAQLRDLAAGTQDTLPLEALPAKLRSEA